MNWLPWKSTMRRPDCRRSFMKATMSLNAASAIPSAWLAMLGRDLLSDRRSRESPSPGSPTKLARGTRQSSKASTAVEEARIPILSSVRSTVKPGAPFSITRAVIEPRSSSISDHLPNSRIKSATSPEVMKILPPSMTTSSPSGAKRVFIPVASDPAPGSVIARDAMAPSATRGMMRDLSSSEPKSSTGPMAWKLVP